MKRLLSALYASGLGSYDGEVSSLVSLVCASPRDLPPADAAPILMPAGLLAMHLDFDTRSIEDDLRGGFFLSAWHGMPSFGCDTDRISLWKWCR